MILDLLGLHDGYLEKDLEAAILHDMQGFLMEVGQGFTFIASQKRMPVTSNKEYILDLLFYSRPLKRLVAVELKLGDSNRPTWDRWRHTSNGSTSTNDKRARRPKNA